MNKSEKIFNHPNRGDIVVSKERDSEGSPVVRFVFNSEGMGNFSTGYNFENSQDGSSKRDDFFDSLTPEKAIKISDEAMKNMDLPDWILPK